MALSIVQARALGNVTQPTSPATTVNFSFATTPTSGNRLYFWIAARSTTNSVAPSLPSGLSWIAGAPVNLTNDIRGGWAKADDPSDGSLNSWDIIKDVSTVKMAVHGYEISGADSTPERGEDGPVNGSSGTASTAGVSANSGDLALFGVINSGANTITTWSDSYTANTTFDTTSSGGNRSISYVATKDLTATATTDPDGTLSASGVWIAHLLVIAASSGTAHEQTVTDSLGLEDVGQVALVLDAGYELQLSDTGAADLYASADPLGLTDSIEVDHTSGGEQRTVTDALGLLDQGTAALFVQGQSFDLLGLEDSGQADLFASADLLGLIDSIVQELTQVGEERTVTDTVGLTDSGSVDQIADQLGITDVILVALNPIDAGATDALGLVDSGTADSFGDADLLGLVDSLDVELTGAGLTATVDDSLGLTDEITVVTSKVLETTNALGLVDSGTADRFGNADLLGITDSVTAEVAGAGEAVVTDPLGLLDTTAQEAATQRSQTDDLGLLDSAAQEISTDRSQTDPLGLVDTVSAESQSTRDQTDDLGLTDSITAELIGAGEASFTDPLELTDTGSGLFEGDADFLGLTDSVFYATGGSESQTVDDLLGLTDSVTGVSDLKRDLSEALGLTDSTETVSAVTRAVTDDLGLTDDVTADLVGAADLVITDPLGLTDDVSVTASFAQTRTDNLGLVDSITVDLVGADEVTNTDPLGLTDNITQVAASSRSQTDNLGLTDSIDVVLIGQLISVSITDLIGLTDDIDRAGGHQRFADNPLGLVDAVTRAIDYSRERIDPLGLTDSITLQAAGPDFWKPRPAPFTRDPVPHTKAPVAYVPVRAGDSPPWN